MSPDILRPSDQLGLFEQQLRTAGTWCDTSVKDELAHYFICRHPTAMIAISLCGTVIKPMEKLRPNTVTQKCLICDLYAQARKETQEKILKQLNHTIDKRAKNSTDKE